MKTSAPVRRSRRYWIRMLILIILAISLPTFILPAAFGGMTMWVLIHPPCAPDSKTPADYQLAYREVNIPAHGGGVYRGYFIAGKKDATIIIPPTYGGNRAGMLDEGSILAQDGYNVLLFDSRECSGGSVHSLGYTEVEDVRDALDYLKQNSDQIAVNMNRVALHGFSSAGATALMAGARYPDIAAVLAEGNYHNMDSYFVEGSRHSFFGFQITLGAQIAYRLATGGSSLALDPLGAVAKIPPRPVFLIYGTLEPSFAGGQLEYAAAQAAAPNANIHLWQVPNANHGGYIAVAGLAEYKRHVLPFYACALLNQCDDWNALWKS